MLRRPVWILSRRASRLLRRATSSTVVGLCAACIVSVMWHRAWPGPNPRARERLEQRVEQWRAWRQVRLPADAPPVSTRFDLMQRLERFTNPPVPLLEERGQHEAFQPVDVGGLTVTEALAAFSQREIDRTSQTGSASAGHLRVTWWNSDPRNDAGEFVLQAEHLGRRWWAPAIIWHRIGHDGDSAFTTAGAAEQLIIENVEQALAESGDTHPYWVLQSSGGTSIAGGAGQLAIAADMVWRIRLQAFVTDLGLVGLIMALVAFVAHSLLAWAQLQLRRSRGLCPACSYELRATPDRCPECGWTPVGQAQVQS